MSLSQKVATNALVQIASKVITVSFTLATTIILTGYLGKEGYGQYMYVLTLVVLFGSIADWGTATIGVREAAKETVDQGKVLANVICLRLFLSLIGGLALSFFAVVSSKFGQASISWQLIAVSGVILLLVANKASFGVVFQTKLKMQYLAIADVLSGLALLIFSYILVQQKASPVMFIGAVMVSSGLAFLVTVLFSIRSIKLKFELDWKLMENLIKESIPMGAVLIILTAVNKIDILILGGIKGPDSVGIYALSYRVYDVLILGAAYFMSSLLPVISQYSNLNKDNKQKLINIYQKSFDILLVMGLVVVIVTWLTAPLMIQILTKNRFNDFIESVNVLRLLAIALFFAYYNHLTGFTVVAIGRQREYFKIAVIALIFNVMTNFILIPYLSFYGAAWITILTEVLVSFSTTLLIFKLLNFRPVFYNWPKTVKEIIVSRGKIF